MNCLPYEFWLILAATVGIGLFFALFMASISFADWLDRH